MKLTGVYKKWENLIDYSIGNVGTVTDPTGTVIYVRQWDNNPDAERKYKGLELESQFNHNQWSFLGNISWSQLKGNYEGEGTSSPGRGEGLNNFNVQDGVNLYDNQWTTPDGYLAGHQPIRMRITGNRTMTNAFGKTSIGLVYSFDSGSHYSQTRTIIPTRLGGPTISPQFGTSATQYQGSDPRCRRLQRRLLPGSGHHPRLPALQGGEQGCDRLCQGGDHQRAQPPAADQLEHRLEHGDGNLRHGHWGRQFSLGPERQLREVPFVHRTSEMPAGRNFRRLPLLRECHFKERGPQGPLSLCTKKFPSKELVH